MSTQIQIRDVTITADTESELNQAMTDLYKSVSHAWTQAKSQTSIPGVLPETPVISDTVYTGDGVYTKEKPKV